MRVSDCVCSRPTECYSRYMQAGVSLLIPSFTGLVNLSVILMVSINYIGNVLKNWTPISSLSLRVILSVCLSV